MVEEYKNIIGKNIRRWRLFRDLTQQQLADKLGCSRQCLNNLELGKNKIFAEDLFRISKLLNVDIKNFYRESEY